MAQKHTSYASQILLEAIELEANNPGRAKALYHQIRAKNAKFYKSIFLFALVMPLCAGLTAFYSARLVPRFQNIFVVAILLLVGYVPPTYLYAILALKKPSSFIWFLINFPQVCFISIFFIFQTFLMALIAALYAIFIYGPILIGVRLFCYALTGSKELNAYFVFIEELLFWPYALLGFFLILVMIARLEWEDLFPLWLGFRTVFAGLLVNWHSFISFLLGVVLGLTILASGMGIFLQTNLYIVLLACFISGVFLGINFAFIEPDFDLSRIVRIGLIRCNIRLANWGFARYHINQALKAERFSCDDMSPNPVTVGFKLASLLMMIADYRRIGLKVPVGYKSILDSASLYSRFETFSREWEANIKQTYLLAEEQGMLKPVRKKHNGKVPVDRQSLVFRIQTVIAVIWGTLLFLFVVVAIWRLTDA